MAKKSFGSFAVKKAEEEASITSSQPEKFITMNISVDEIRDNDKNMETYTDDADQDSLLIEDIRANGLKQALTVFPDPNIESTFIILAGHRRFKACKELGYLDLPCLVVTGRSQKDRLVNQITSVTTNIIRRNASPFERSKEIIVLQESIRQLRKIEPTYYDTGFTREILAEQTGMTERQLAKYLKVGAHFPQEAAALAGEANLTINELSEVVTILKSDPATTAIDVVANIKARKEEEIGTRLNKQLGSVDQILLKKANSLRSATKRAGESEIEMNPKTKAALIDVLQETLNLMNEMF